MPRLSPIGKQDISLHYRFTYGLIFVLLHLFKRNKTLESLLNKIRNRIVISLKKRRQAQGLKSGETFQVERVKNLSQEDFQAYVRSGTPVIFESEALEWDCTKKWNLDYLEQKFGHLQIKIVSRNGLMRKSEKKGLAEQSEYSEELSIKEFVGDVKSGGKKYLRFSSLLETIEELKKDLNFDWLRKMRPPSIGASIHTFIGPKKSGTPLHAGMPGLLFVMAHGEKKWTIFPPYYFPLLGLEKKGTGYHFSDVDPERPDLKKYPGFDLLHRYTCHLKPGDVLYFPAWYFHSVENLTESWGIGYRFPYVRNILKSSVTLTFVRFFLSHPPFWKVIYYSFFKSDVDKRENLLLTPKISK